MVKLYEMFSPLGGPNTNEEPEVDWADDLKFFIDNDSDVLSNVFFPAVKKHERYHGHPDAYKIYIRPLQQCKEVYCNKFDIDDPETKFPPETIIDLAKKIADEQHKHIEAGDYK